MMKLIAVILALLCSATAALAQGAILQGGPWAPGHAPMYTGQGSGQAVVQDSGPAGGGGTGYGLSEQLLVARGTGTPPYVGQGTGPFGTNWCDYDAPITNPTGYHFLCLTANASGGGMLAYGAGGGASALPFTFNINGTNYSLPNINCGVATAFTVGCIQGDGATLSISGPGVISVNLSHPNSWLAAQTFSAAIVPTRSPGDNTTNAASTAFVQSSAAGSPVKGPSSSTPGDVAIWNNATGTLLKDSGLLFSLGSFGQYILNVDHTNGVDQIGCGLASSGAGACKTNYYAVQLFQSTIILGPGVTPVVQSDCGFTENPPQEFIGPVSGNGFVFILGNPGSPSSCSWTSTGVTAGLNSSVHIEGFETINAGSAQTWATVTKTSVLVTKNMVWGPAVSGQHIQIFDGGTFVVDAGGTEQVGDASCAPNCFTYHIINSGGTVEEENQTISVPSALTFTAWYVGQYSGSNWATVGLTFTGAGAGSGSTGLPYLLSRNATLRLTGSTLPGNSASAVRSGACDDNSCVPNQVLPFSATQPCTTPTEGAITAILDATVNSIGAVVSVGGGSFYVDAQCESTAWRVISVIGAGVDAGSVATGILPIARGGTGNGTGASPALFVTNTTSLSQNTQNYCGLTACGGGGAQTSFPVQRAGTFKNLNAYSSVAPVAGQTYTITIYEGGLKLVTCTISNPATSCADVTHSDTHAAGNTFFVRIDLSATAGAASFAVGVELDP